jgi:hypothetical protein
MRVNKFLVMLVIMLANLLEMSHGQGTIQEHLHCCINSYIQGCGSVSGAVALLVVSESSA